MKITRIEIRPMRDEGNLKAFCSVVFDDVFIVHSVKVIQGKDSLFVAMPSQEVKNGQFRDTAHPIDNEFRMSMESLILDKYHSFMNQARTLVPSEIRTEDVTL
ncbi:SpoVG family protein [Candidatus Bipolaricaulota bacterium]|nr:SpoVG family protein [Candidatus Bipolaricaulota bacterium]